MLLQYVIGVDPGLSGALALFHSGGRLIDVIDIPTEEVGNGFVKRQVNASALANQIWERIDADECQRTVAIVERVTAMPGQGVSTMLSLGDSRGTIRGVFGAIGIPIEEVLPQRWKKEMGLIEPREKGAGPMSQQEKNERQRRAKAASVEMVRRAYPDHAHTVARAKDHNRAEAVLIGSWSLLKRAGKL